MAILLTFFLSASVALALIHYYALEFFLYWKYLWLDLPMHALGGVCVALGIAVLPFFNIHLPPRFNGLFGTLLGVLIVGVIWEIFEFQFGLAGLDVQPDFVFDTTLDLILDVVGGTLGYYVATSIKKLG